MSERSLGNRRILIVEDEYLLAEDLRYQLARAGASVVGMASTVEDAIGVMSREDRLDAAVLDVNLAGKPVFPAADLLTHRGIPLLFITGYDVCAIPARFHETPKCEKPFDSAKIIRFLDKIFRG